MKRNSESLRLFVAAYPPMETALALSRALPQELLPFVRNTAPEQIHLTLLFLGKVMPKELEAVTESIDRSCAGQGAFQLSFEKLTVLPRQRPKRIVVATTNVPSALLEIRSRLTRRLSRQSRERPNDRFLPHLTLARFQQPQALVLEEPLSLDPISISEIRLMRSQLMPGGAKHALVHACELENA